MIITSLDNNLVIEQGDKNGTIRTTGAIELGDMVLSHFDNENTMTAVKANTSYKCVIGRFYTTSAQTINLKLVPFVKPNVIGLASIDVSGSYPSIANVIKSIPFTIESLTFTFMESRCNRLDEAQSFLSGTLNTFAYSSTVDSPNIIANNIPLTSESSNVTLNSIPSNSTVPIDLTINSTSRYNYFEIVASYKYVIQSS